MDRYIQLSTLNPSATPPMNAGTPPSLDPFDYISPTSNPKTSSAIKATAANMSTSLAKSDELEDIKIGHSTKPDVTNGESSAERDFVVGIDESQQEKMRNRGKEGGKKGMGTRRAARLDGTRTGPGKKL